MEYFCVNFESNASNLSGRIVLLSLGKPCILVLEEEEVEEEEEDLMEDEVEEEEDEEELVRGGGAKVEGVRCGGGIELLREEDVLVLLNVVVVGIVVVGIVVGIVVV